MNTEILTTTGIIAEVISENLPASEIQKLTDVIEQDILFSELEEIKKITVVEKNNDKDFLYKNSGVSFYHTLGGVDLHIRIS